MIAHTSRALPRDAQPTSLAAALGFQTVMHMVSHMLLQHRAASLGRSRGFSPGPLCLRMSPRAVACSKTRGVAPRRNLELSMRRVSYGYTLPSDPGEWPQYLDRSTPTSSRTCKETPKTALAKCRCNQSFKVKGSPFSQQFRTHWQPIQNALSAGLSECARAQLCCWACDLQTSKKNPTARPRCTGKTLETQ